MRSCIYARADRKEKSHSRTSIERQVERCLELGRQHNLIIETRHVFRDMEHDGTWPPACWTFEDDANVRPALSAMVDAIESGTISAVVVFRADRLATSSDVLQRLLALFDQHDISVVVSPEALISCDDPTDAFAVSMLRPRLVHNTIAERDKNEKLRARKVEELTRLRSKVARLEDEIAALK